MKTTQTSPVQSRQEKLRAALQLAASKSISSSSFARWQRAAKKKSVKS